MRLSVLGREFSSYFLRLVALTCHAYMPLDMEFCLPVTYGTSIIYYVNLKAVLPSVTQAVCSLQSHLPWLDSDGPQGLRNCSLPANAFAHTPNDKHGFRH